MPASKKNTYARYTLAALERLGQLVAVARKEQRVTAQDLAERVGVSRAMIETGLSNAVRGLLREHRNAVPGIDLGLVFGV